jgi:hypothetical protein
VKKQGEKPIKEKRNGWRRAIRKEKSTVENMSETSKENVVVVDLAAMLLGGIVNDKVMPYETSIALAAGFGTGVAIAHYGTTKPSLLTGDAVRLYSASLAGMWGYGQAAMIATTEAFREDFDGVAKHIGTIGAVFPLVEVEALERHEVFLEDIYSLTARENEPSVYITASHSLSELWTLVRNI